MFRTIRPALSTLALAALALGSATSAQAFDIGGALGIVNSSAGSTAPADPDSFIKSAAGAEKLMNNSLHMLTRSLVSKETAAKIEAALTSASTLTDQNERQAKMLEANKDAVAALNEQASGDKLKAGIDKMNTAQRAQIGASAFNFSLALLQDKALVDQSKALISGLSGNPAQLSKLAPVRDTVSSLTNQVEIGSKIAGLMPEIFKTVGIKAPASKDDKPKQVATSDKGD